MIKEKSVQSNTEKSQDIKSGIIFTKKKFFF